MHRLLTLVVSLLLLSPLAAAQFGNIFEQMFSGQGHQQQHHQQPQNVPSDSDWYQKTYQGAHCDKYLCPDTLACVHFPHHCPCAWPNTEDKVEIGEKLKVCASKGGYKAGEMARKVELARKGLL